jgi:hypothetical protein
MNLRVDRVLKYLIHLHRYYFFFRFFNFLFGLVALLMLLGSEYLSVYVMSSVSEILLAVGGCLDLRHDVCSNDLVCHDQRVSVPVGLVHLGEEFLNIDASL